MDLGGSIRTGCASPTGSCDRAPSEYSSVTFDLAANVYKCRIWKIRGLNKTITFKWIDDTKSIIIIPLVVSLINVDWVFLRCTRL